MTEENVVEEQVSLTYILLQGHVSVMGQWARSEISTKDLLKLEPKYVAQGPPSEHGLLSL